MLYFKELTAVFVVGLVAMWASVASAGYPDTDHDGTPWSQELGSGTASGGTLTQAQSFEVFPSYPHTRVDPDHYSFDNPVGMMRLNDGGGWMTRNIGGEGYTRAAGWTVEFRMQMGQGNPRNQDGFQVYMRVADGANSVELTFRKGNPGQVGLKPRQLFEFYEWDTNTGNPNPLPISLALADPSAGSSPATDYGDFHVYRVVRLPGSGTIELYIDGGCAVAQSLLVGACALPYCDGGGIAPVVEFAPSVIQSRIDYVRFHPGGTPPPPCAGSHEERLEVEMAVLEAKLDNLPAGPQGPQGEAGAAGANGSAGAAGAQGPQGPAGADADCVACADVANGAVNLACLVLGENVPSSVADIEAAALVIVDTLLISTNICEDPCDIGSEIQAAIDAKVNP